MSNSKSKLLCFAHKGEAQAFLNEYKWKANKDSRLELFEGESFDLLITGEGLWKSMSNLSQLLGLFPKKYESIINLGVAGSLNERAQKNQIYEIALSLAEATQDKLEYKSYACEEAKDGLYCISSHDRVLSSQYAEKLRLHADIIDRELWALSYVAQQNKITISSYKLISDIAGESTDCFDIKEHAEDFSYKLFDYFQSKINPYNEKVFENKTEKNELLNSLLEDERFHFTKSQSHQLEKILDSLVRRQKRQESLEVFSEKSISRLVKEVNRPKDRSRELIEMAMSELNPFHTKIQNKLSHWFSEKPRSILQVQTDPSFETSNIRLNISIQSPKDLDEACDFLSQLPFEEWENVLNGNIENV